MHHINHGSQFLKSYTSKEQTNDRGSYNCIHRIYVTCYTDVTKFNIGPRESQSRSQSISNPVFARWTPLHYGHYETDVHVQ